MDRIFYEGIKYCLTAFGRRAIATDFKLRETAAIPLLQGMLPTEAYCQIIFLRANGKNQRRRK